MNKKGYNDFTHFMQSFLFIIFEASVKLVHKTIRNKTLSEKFVTLEKKVTKSKICIKQMIVLYRVTNFKIKKIVQINFF